MLNELGDEILDNSSIEMFTAENNGDASNEATLVATENLVLNDALSSVARLKEIEDIRAMFQILGIGS